MWDYTVEVIGLKMVLPELGESARAELPEKYGWRFYQPGDEVHWARMWTSAGGFKSEEAALETFRRDFPDADALKERMIFLTDGGVPFATVAVWFGENPEQGRLHWVCIDEAHQNQGLSAPLIALSLDLCRRLGCTNAYLHTNTPNWVAIRMYHRFGFVPFSRGERDNEGWKIVSEKAKIDFMKYIG